MPNDTPLRRPRHVGPFGVAVVAELVTLALSVAANLAAVWHDDTAQIWVAGALPVLLLLATYLFLAHRVPTAWRVGASGWLAWYANLASGVALLVPVAMTSYWHQRMLLLGSDGYGTAHGLPTLLATLLPLTVDGLAMRAALTLWTTRGASAVTPERSNSAPGDSGNDEPALESPSKTTVAVESPATTLQLRRRRRPAAGPVRPPARSGRSTRRGTAPAGAPKRTGAKSADAKAWTLYQWSRGNDPSLAEINGYVGSDSLIKRGHLLEWRTEKNSNGHPLSVVGER